MSVLEIFGCVNNRYLDEEVCYDILGKYLIKNSGIWIYVNGKMIFFNPIHWDLTNDGTKMYSFPIQVAKDPYNRAYFTQEFIVELFGRYCRTWIYSEQKSKKKVYVFTRPCKISGDYEWCIIVQIPKIYNATFQVVLSKKNTKILNTKDVVFQCYFPLHLLQNFYLSSWKANTIFRYHYVERYLEYMEPLVFECINNK